MYDKIRSKYNTKIFVMQFFFEFLNKKWGSIILLV